MDIAADIDIRLIRATALLVVAPMLSLLCAAELVLARLVDEGLDSTFLGFGDATGVATGVVRLLLEGGKCILLISLRDIRRPSSLDMAPFVFDFALLCVSQNLNAPNPLSLYEAIFECKVRTLIRKKSGAFGDPARHSANQGGKRGVR